MGQDSHIENMTTLSIVAESIKSLIKPEWVDLAKSISKLVALKIIDDEEYYNQLADVMFKTYSTIFTDEFKDYIKRKDIAYKENLINNLGLLGNYGWCSYTISSQNEDLSNAKFLNGVAKLLQENPDVTTKEIDEYNSKYFTRKVINNILQETDKYLDASDKKKLNQAMTAYRGKRYFECSNLLAGLIDSQSIKQNLADIKNGKYPPDEKGNQNISQGWRAFQIVFQNNFTIYFGNESFNGNSKKASREKGFEDFVEKVTPNLHNYKITVPFLNLSFCLLRFFDDSDWKNYPNNKPEVINRHWLMHGMYDIEDITKADCIKLMLMLNQLSELYGTLEK